MDKPTETSGLSDEVRMQRDYYKNTAAQYDEAHINGDIEHLLALRFLSSIIDFYGFKSILDLGGGTGRLALYLKRAHPDISIVSIEPVKELREIGYQKGLTRDELIDGDATALHFRDAQFDLICAFALLHHVKSPSVVIDEMLRVSRLGIFISDANNFGQGSPAARAIKQCVNALALWRVFDFIKTKGKGYTISEGDGLAYSYSVFNNYRQITDKCHTHILNTRPAGINPYKTATHVALLGLKK